MALLPLLVIGGVLLAAGSGSSSSSSSGPAPTTGDGGRTTPKPKIAIPNDPAKLSIVTTIDASTGFAGTQTVPVDLSAWPDLVTYGGIPSYPSGWVLRDKPIGLLSWSVRLRPKPIKTRRLEGVRVKDPRLVAIELGLEPADLDTIARTFVSDGRLTRIDKSKPLSAKRGLAWPDWLRRYPEKGEAWILRAGIYSVPFRGTDVLAILPFLARSQVAALLEGSQPIDPEELWRIYLAALTYWSDVAGTASPAEQLADYFTGIFGQTYYGGGLDKNPRTTPTSEAVGWFSTLVVGPTATFLAAYGSGSTGSASSSG